MTARFPARGHTCDLERNNLIPQQSDDPADGTDEPLPAFLRPVHGLGEGSLQDQLRERAGEDPGRAAPRDPANITVLLRFAVGQDFQLIDFQTLFLRKSRDCDFGRGLSGSPDTLFGFRLGLFDAFNPDHQTTRCRICPYGDIPELVLLQQVADCASEVVEGAGQHPVRNFFSADFEKEIHAALSFGTAAPYCCSTQDSATPTASFLTRPITATRSVTLIAPRASRVLKRLLHFST